MATSAAETIRKHLEPGEKLLWSGRPRQGIVFRLIDLLLVPFSMLWGGFALVWEYMVVTQMPFNDGGVALIFPVAGFLFSLVGLYMIAGRFVADRYCRAHLAYGITDKRAVIVAEAPWRTVTSYEIDTLRGLRLVERGNGRGTVFLTDTEGSIFANGYGWRLWHPALGNWNTLFEIEAPKEVLRLLRELRQKK